MEGPVSRDLNFQHDIYVLSFKYIVKHSKIKGNEPEGRFLKFSLNSVGLKCYRVQITNPLAKLIYCSEEEHLQESLYI